MIKILVKVKPNARVSELTQADDGSWHARIKSPPVDNKANEELMKLVAARFDVPKSQVTIKKGSSARTKLLQIDDAT